MRIPVRLQGPLVSVATFLVLLAAVEGGARLWIARHPPARVAPYLWDWERMWSSDLETVGLATDWPLGAEFNASGLRDRSHPEERTPRTYRVVFLGDSVTMGHGIEASQAYPQALQRLLDRHGRRIEVFNVALQGWSTHQERLAYARLARPYAPDLVVLAVCLNDVAELQNNLGRPPGWLVALHARSALVRLIVNASGREIREVEELFLKPDAWRVRRGFERFGEELRALRQAVAADGGSLRVIVFPFRFQVEPHPPEPVAQRALAAICERESLTWLDLLPRLARLGPGAFVDYDHLSPSGSAAVADALLNSGWLPDGYDRRGLLPGLRASNDETARLALLAALADPQALVREAAAWELGQRGPAARFARDRLCATLTSDADVAVRCSAARALGRLADGGSEAALFRALDDASQPVRWASAEALARLRPAGPTAVEALAAALDSRDSYVRGFAAWSLGRLGAAAAPALPGLLRLLEQDEDHSVLAARALAALGPAARPALPAVLALLHSPAASSRAAAAQALGRLGPPAAGLALPDLVRALQDDDPRVRAEAARALGRLGQADPEVVEALTGALGDEHEHVQILAARALGWLGPAAAAAVPALERQVRTAREGAAGEAQTALDAIQPRQR